MTEENFIEFYNQKVRPLIVKGLMKVPRYKIVDNSDTKEYWRLRAELFNRAMFCVDAFVNDPKRAELELQWLEQFVEMLPDLSDGGDKHV